METDPPLFHFDIDAAQLHELISDPQSFLRKIGLGPEQGIAHNGNVSVITNFAQQWTSNGWKALNVDNEPRMMPTKPSCCYVSGDTCSCHVHG